MRSERIRVYMMCVALLACLSSAWRVAAAEEPSETWVRASDADMQWWREARFGLFVHWGPVSLKGTEIGWSRGGERRGTGGTGAIPVEVYDNLYREFNPVDFGAKEWVSIAKAAGMQYLVFTTKHHDGFSMFDSALTDYKITHSPFRRDVVAELAEACHEAGLRLGFYYSPPDWHHPDYRAGSHGRYVDYLHGQLRELCTNYGRVDVIWFDGLGGKAEDWDAPNLFRMIRTLQPHALINNRAGLSGDFDTPEQQVGRFQRGRAWESCITICNQWAWKPDDRLKPLKECIDTLVRCAGGDGNLLLNVGPMPTGQIEARQVERLKEIGAWLKDYGQTIYQTRGGPFLPGPWGASTCKGNLVYVHVLQWPEGPLHLPALCKRVVAHSVLTGGKVRVRQSGHGLTISAGGKHRNPLDTIVVLELAGSACDITPRQPPSGSVARAKPATASNVFQNMPEYGPDKAFDDDPATRWATDAGVHEAWIEVDLGGRTRINRAFLSEAFDRVRSFELQYRVDDTWRTLFAGQTIGESRSVSFKRVKARHVRLHIMEATDGPTLWEFQLFDSRGKVRRPPLGSNPPE